MLERVELESNPVRASARRVMAMVKRYIYLILGSFPRIMELVYWPFVQLLLWGFVQLHLMQTTSFYAHAGGVLVGAVLLWDILLRSQFGFSLSFLEEMWSRNMGNIFMSPLRPAELVAALTITSLCRLVIGLLPVILMANLFFGFNLFGLGLGAAAFFVNLVITGWAIGLLSCGAVLRYGMGAESFTWIAAFFLLPLCCVYYPVSTLPPWLQYVSLSLPPTYVFEGLRALLIETTYRGDLMWRALALNACYFAGCLGAFRFFLWRARAMGSLMQMGE
jgi:ABC-2 type transport system permease protein